MLGEKKLNWKLPYLLTIVFLIMIFLSDIMYNDENRRKNMFPEREENMFTGEDLTYLRNRSKTIDGKYTGVGKGKNLIVIQVEALQDFVIGLNYDGQEITPNLNKLIANESGLYFSKYFELIGRGKTSDAEFATQNSLYPSMDNETYTAYQDNTFYGLPWILRDNGYTSWAFHGYKKEFWNRDKVYPKQGFERFISEEDYQLGETLGFGLTDEDFFEQSISYIKEMKKPFYAFMITLSNHSPFEIPEKYQKISLRKEHKGTLLGNYFQTVHYTDEQIGKFIENLKREGLYEDTIICLYGDHFGLLTSDEKNVRVMTDFLGYPYDFDEMMNIPLIISIPGSGIKEEISNVGSHLDFLPTILNILGLKNEKGVMYGVDLVNSDKGFAPQQMYASKGSFIDNEKMFVMSKDGIYDHSRAFHLDTREPVDIKECRSSYERAIRELNKCDFLLKNNLMKDIIHGKENFDDVQVEYEKIRNDDMIAIVDGTKESLDKSYRNGFRMIEVNLQWTSDDELILLNDWNENLPYSHEEFMNLEMPNGLHQMDIEHLADWMRKHEDVYIVTDIREENPRALRYINNNYPDIKERIIPQIYSMDEYNAVKVPKYKNIILNLGLSNYTDQQVVDFMKLYKHFAVIMPKDRGMSLLPKKLKIVGVPSYVFQVNERSLRNELESNGVYGISTEKLKPW